MVFFKLSTSRRRHRYPKKVVLPIFFYYQTPWKENFLFYNLKPQPYKYNNKRIEIKTKIENIALFLRGGYKYHTNGKNPVCVRTTATVFRGRPGAHRTSFTCTTCATLAAAIRPCGIDGIRPAAARSGTADPKIAGP